MENLKEMYKNSNINNLPDGVYDMGDYVVTVETLDLEEIKKLEEIKEFSKDFKTGGDADIDTITKYLLEQERHFQVRAIDANHAGDPEIDRLNVLTVIVQAENEGQAILDFMQEGNYNHNDVMVIDVREVYMADCENLGGPFDLIERDYLPYIFHMDESLIVLPITE